MIRLLEGTGSMLFRILEVDEFSSVVRLWNQPRYHERGGITRKQKSHVMGLCYQFNKAGTVGSRQVGCLCISRSAGRSFVAAHIPTQPELPSFSQGLTGLNRMIEPVIGPVSVTSRSPGPQAAMSVIFQHLDHEDCRRPVFFKSEDMAFIRMGSS